MNHPTDFHPDITIEITPRLSQLVIIRKIINSISTTMGFTEKDILQLEMSVDEACSNSILAVQAKEGEAASAKLRLEISIHDKYLKMVIADCGNDFSEHYHKANPFHERTDRTQRGGYGLQIIKTFMDEVHYSHEPEIGNKLILTKYLTSS